MNKQVSALSRGISKAVRMLVVASGVFALSLTGCATDSPVAPTAKTETLQSLNFLKLGKAEPSLQKIVSVSKKITHRKGGVLKLKHRYRDENGNKVTVRMRLRIPPKSISRDAEVSLTIDDEVFLGNLDVVFQPHGVTFAKPAILDIKVNGIDLSKVNVANLGMYYDNVEAGGWEPMEFGNVSVHRGRKEIFVTSAKLPHFSRYAIGGGD